MGSDSSENGRVLGNNNQNARSAEIVITPFIKIITEEVKVKSTTMRRLSAELIRRTCVAT